MRILGIETSCDDTGAAVVEDGRILSNIVAAQDIHLEYGGVVPELASRAHITLLPRVVDEALGAAGTKPSQIDAVAVTIGPGLQGSLLVGIEFAKGFAMARGIPWVGVNHVEAHLVSAGLESELNPPYVGMVASGGHTEIYHVPEKGVFRRVGSTRDDAVGEAFDKIGKLLGLPYPAGPHLDRLAREGRADQVPLPKARLKGDTLDLSMSGLKTAAKLFLEREPHPIPDARLRDIAASVEKAIVDALVERLAQALSRFEAGAVTVAGGCACNTLLRRETARLAHTRGIPALFPSPKLCRDNGAMIAYAGSLRLQGGQTTPFSATAIANLDSFSSLPV
ncbi:MAG: tRNA (adenosine(37)-N6)-threonylcarbamoyltransferase complex transferase subunit TsaD [Candidatus Eisenbacteria bacterium]|uniref:tRNA N6-adenosine threonylcarbamoyltransferase n=1 Tax=Eiseniibacteriota bacterium TaxID=2212470 RepID=A0A538T3G1_UNCEI|nr:MAG: tRNA (adenosine(37)-N6)-threonylcarbamoyltransferase complex transferase subunit TsaD [Candidatus Eisenbacteria bacterium]